MRTARSGTAQLQIPGPLPVKSYQPARIIAMARSCVPRECCADSRGLMLETVSPQSTKDPSFLWLYHRTYIVSSAVFGFASLFSAETSWYNSFKWKWDFNFGAEYIMQVKTVLGGCQRVPLLPVTCQLVHFWTWKKMKTKSIMSSVIRQIS